MFDWRDYLKVAKDLAQKPSKSEAEFRTLVGRAYWAAFKHAESFLLTKQVTLVPQSIFDSQLKRRREESHHEIVIRELNQLVIGAAAKLRNLHDRRNKCDYKVSLNFDWTEPRETSALIDRADAIIKAIDSTP